jgi:ribokinase
MASAARGRVVVVGSVNVDLVVTADRLPSPGETVIGGTFERHHGGKGANQAVAAARLGARTVFVGAVGGDSLGTEARAALEAEGIELLLGIADDQPTGVALIIVDRAGENLITVASGANGSLDAGEVHRALDSLSLVPGDVVLVGCEIPPAAAREALQAARAAGVRSILNPAPAHGLHRSVFGLADILTPNRPELTSLVHAESRRLGRPAAVQPPERAARSLLERNAEGDGVREAVLVSLGAAGAVLVTPAGEPVELPPPEVAPLDTVGAGDALNGALAAGLAAGLSLTEAAPRAVTAATLAVTRRGAREGMPTRAELEAALNGQAAGSGP